MNRLLKCFGSIVVVAMLGIAAFMLSSKILHSVDISELIGVANPDVEFLAAYLLPILLMLTGVVLFNRVVLRPKERTMWSIRGFNPLVHLWCLALLVALAVALSPLMRLLPASGRVVPTSLWAVVTMTVVAPVMEEILFRGNIFSVMRASCSPTLAAVISSALFAAMHGETAVAIEAFFAGMIFSCAYILTRSIFAPIILHILNNIVAYVLLNFTYQEKSIRDYIGALSSFDMIYAISLGVLILGLVYIVYVYYRADRGVKQGKLLRDVMKK